MVNCFKKKFNRSSDAGTECHLEIARCLCFVKVNRVFDEVAAEIRKSQAYFQIIKFH